MLHLSDEGSLFRGASFTTPMSTPFSAEGIFINWKKNSSFEANYKVRNNLFMDRKKKFFAFATAT